MTLSDEHWYDLGKFFDQVLHLDDERLLRFRQAVGLPGFNRLLRLAETTCGDDAKAEAGLTEELIARRRPSRCWRSSASIRRSWRRPITWSSTCRTARTSACPAPSTARRRRTPSGSSSWSSEFLRAARPSARVARSPIMSVKLARPSCSPARPTGSAARPRWPWRPRGTPLGLIDRDGAALAALAQDLVEAGRDRRRRRGRCDRPRGPAPRRGLDRGRDRAGRRAGRLRRHRHARPWSRTSIRRCCARRSRST